MKKPGVLSLLLVGSVVSAPASAQLIRQTVEGVWRYCVYRGPVSIGSPSPRQPLGTRGERAIRVGRGEPCPQAYRDEDGRQSRARAKGGGYVVTQ